MAGMLRSKATMFSQRPRFAISDQVWNFLDLSRHLINTWLQLGASARHRSEKPLKRLSFTAYRCTALKRGVNESKENYKSQRNFNRAIESRNIRYPKSTWQTRSNPEQRH